MRFRGSRINSGSFGSLGRVLWDVEFIRVRFVNSGTPPRSSCSFGIVGLIRETPRRYSGTFASFSLLGTPRGLSVHSGSFGSFGRNASVARLIGAFWSAT